MNPPPSATPEHLDIAHAMANVRTKRDIEAVLRYFGIRASRRLGQNFLVDHNLLAFMVRQAAVCPDDLVLDIGCGTGLLTAHLADAAGKVVGVELDRRLFAICSRYLEGRPIVELLQGVALASKQAMSPLVLDAVERAWRTGRYASLRVVSNLPYSVASLVVPNLLEAGLDLALMLVTVQREVGERLAAAAGSKGYGALSVVVQAHAAVGIVRAVPPSVFWPRPRVASALVRVVPEPARRARIVDYGAFASLVRGAFCHRRKRLANALTTSHVVGDRAAAAALLARGGIEPTARAEQVSVEQYIALANALAARAR